MAITLDGTTGITTPGLTNTGTETIVNLTTTGNTILGNTSTDTLNVGNGDLVKDASGNVGIGVTPSAWGSPLSHAIELVQGTGITAHSGSATSYYTSNAYYNGSNWIYKSSVKATLMTMSGSDGSFGWNTAPSGTAGNTITFTQAMTLDASGNLLVGTTGASFIGDAGIKLSPAGDGSNWPRVAVVTNATTNAQNNGFSLYSSGAGVYRFYVGAGGTIFATATTITAISDQRLKENVKDLDIGLDAIMAVKPRRFDWKEGKGLDKKDDVGFIAQEFETVFPNSVTESLAGEDGIAYKSLNHSELIPTLVKAIQEQQALITSLTARLEVLEAK